MIALLLQQLIKICSTDPSKFKSWKVLETIASLLNPFSGSRGGLRNKRSRILGARNSYLNSYSGTFPTQATSSLNVSVTDFIKFENGFNDL